MSIDEAALLARVERFDDINHHIRDAYTLPICSDCARAITRQETAA